VKRVVLLFVSLVAGLSLTGKAAQAQQSGSMQVTARVVDTREGWSGLNSARGLAASLDRHQSRATVETSLASVSLEMKPSGEYPDRPRTASIVINYLRN
jgi:hypothetical protein